MRNQNTKAKLLIISIKSWQETVPLPDGNLGSSPIEEFRRGALARFSNPTHPGSEWQDPVNIPRKIKTIPRSETKTSFHTTRNKHLYNHTKPRSTQSQQTRHPYHSKDRMRLKEPTLPSHQQAGSRWIGSILSQVRRRCPIQTPQTPGSC